MGQNKRQQPGGVTYDPGSIHAMEFSQASGAQKVSEIGRSLSPLGNGANGYTTDASTIRVLPSAGRNLAVFNNGATLASITPSTNPSQASLGPGQTDALGNVGIPCLPNTWTYLACNMRNFVVTSSQSLLVFLIDDDTYIQPEFKVLPGN